MREGGRERGGRCRGRGAQGEPDGGAQSRGGRCQHGVTILDPVGVGGGCDEHSRDLADVEQDDVGAAEAAPDGDVAVEAQEPGRAVLRAHGAHDDLAQLPAGAAGNGARVHSTS